MTKARKCWRCGVPVEDDTPVGLCPECLRKAVEEEVEALRAVLREEPQE